MKISTKLLTSVGIAILGVSTINLVAKSNIENKKSNEIAKEYVKENAPDKYFSLLEKESNGQTIRWNKAVENIKDSLRIDSMCKKAYFDGAQMAKDSIYLKGLSDGAQMIRDSIKNANESIAKIKQNGINAIPNDISKTVVKSVMK